MKNLIPLVRKMAYWDDIVDSKHLSSRASLKAIRNDVENRFSAYTNHTHPITLETIPASPFVPPHIDLLKDCYSKSNGLSILKKRIKERQSFLLRGECQYCNIGEPTTFDHYLPQDAFPEFSALSINLIPCCSKCNTEKGEEWILLGRRKVVNLYFDTLPSISYLQCTITYKKSTPQATFSIDSAIIPGNMRTIITNHFNTLKLEERYKEKSNSEITDVLNAIAPSAGLLTKGQIQNQLITEAGRMKTDKGTNYWRAVLRIALAHSDRFLTDAGF